MNAFVLAGFDGEPEVFGAKEARRLVQIKPRFIPVRCGPEDRNPMMCPVCGDPLPRPTIAIPQSPSRSG